MAFKPRNGLRQCFLIDDAHIFGWIIVTPEGLFNDSREVGFLFGRRFPFADTATELNYCPASLLSGKYEILVPEDGVE